MRKRLLFVLALMAFGLTGAWADELTGKQALELAQQFVASHNLRKSAPTVKEAGQVSGLYVFNVSGDGGFVIVSNDDQTVPILGFGQRGNIDINDLPDNMRAWLEGYADQIAWVKKYGGTNGGAAKAPRRTAAPKADVGPLVTSHWNQGVPYNNLCPEIDGEKTVTGCVATTTAQLMYYHYVHNGFAASSTALEGYTASTKDKNKASYNLTVNGLDATTFAWDKMIDNYTPINPETGKRYLAGTSEQQQAVATLMRYVGTALHMMYGLSANGGSSAYSEAIPYALKHCFGYDGGVRHCYRKNYSYSAWVDLIYSELAANRPVALGGQSAGGGHSFICDGYKSESDIDYFHINWGWGGSSDNYFVLSVLQPWEQGIGGSSTLDGFSFGQSAVIGIQKTADTKDYCMSLERLDLGGSDATKTFTRTASTDAFTGISLYYIVFDYYYGSNAFDYAVQLVDGSGEVKHTFYEASNKTMEWNDYNAKKFNDAALTNLSIPAKDDNDTYLTDGTYYIKVMSRLHGETNWQECFDGDAYKLTAVISGNDLTISVPIPASELPTGVTFAVSGESCTGSEQTVTATVTAGNGNYSGDIVLHVNGTAVMGQIAHIPAGTNVNLTFSYIPSVVGNNTLTLRTQRNGGKQIEGSETISISTLVINNSANNTSLIQNNDKQNTNVKLAGRTLYKDGDWNTLCLPFNLTLTGSLLADAEVRTLSDANFTNGVLTLNFDDPVSTISAGTPYIIRWDKAVGYDAAEPATRDITDPVFEDVTIAKDFNDFESADGKVQFQGRYSAGTYRTEDRSILFLGDDNTLYFPQPALTDPTQSYNAETNPWQYPSIGACRSFFQLVGIEAGDPAAGVREFVLNFGEGNEDTGICPAEIAEEAERADAWYTLDGRKLDGKPSVKGLYIRSTSGRLQGKNNGRKVVVK